MTCFHTLLFLGSGAADGLADANRCLEPLRRPGPSELSELEEDGTVALCAARLGSELADGIGSVEPADGIGSVKLDCTPADSEQIREHANASNW